MVRSECVVKIVPGERFTPFSLAEQLGAKIILESSSFQKGRERYSVLLVREAFQLTQDERGIFLRLPDSGPVSRVKSRARDILDVCQYFADQHGPVHQDFPFPAGGVGYLSYEFSRFCDTIHFAKQNDQIGLPDAAFMFGHVFVVFDHYTDKLILIGFNYLEAAIALQEELSDLEALLLDGITAGESAKAPAGPGPQATRIDSESDSDAEYMRRVDAVRKEVIAGNLLQAVPSRRLTMKSDINPLDAYRYLRSNNPSPYLFLINFGDYQLFGASPEVHVKVRDGQVSLRPIAGTRRRGATPEEDLALEQELLADPKERAEHLMLVDLGRNDLGRVCVPGSVKVSDYMTIERYSHVMHIVSQVEGQLVPGKTGIDALRATFPAGTVSGAPKISAIEILSRLESRQRRFYAGAIGYMEPGGNIDTCIGIRCAVKKGSRLFLQAGGGVVFDSTPERELEETREKLGAVLRAVGVDPKALFNASDAPTMALEEEEDTTYAFGFAEAGSAVEIQGHIDTLVEEKDYADQTSELPGNENDLDPWAEADAEAAALSGNDGIVSLDWDFDPDEATGAMEIQSEIDLLIDSQSDDNDDPKGVPQ